MYDHFVPQSLYADGGIKIRQIRHADLTNRIPVLTEGLCLPRSEEGKIRLVVGIDSCHQLNIGSIGISKTAIPRIAKLMISPGPLFLSRCNMVIGDMNHAGLRGVIVAPREVTLGIRNHVACWDRNIRIPAQIVWQIRSIRHKIRGLLIGRNSIDGAASVVDSVVNSLAEGKLCDRALGVVSDESYIIWKEGLILFMNPRRNVGPPQKGLRILRPVVEPDSKFEVGFARA